MIHTRKFWLKYLIMTGVVWAFYGCTLPVYFYFVFSWGWDEVLTWWVTGTPVEFILAYPLTRIIVYTDPKVEKFVNKVTAK